jgi:hypothetical protein
MRTRDGVRHLFLILRVGDYLFLAVVKTADNLFIVTTGWCHLKTRLHVLLRVIRHTENQVTRLRGVVGDPAEAGI